MLCKNENIIYQLKQPFWFIYTIGFYIRLMSVNLYLLKNKVFKGGKSIIGVDMHI